MEYAELRRLVSSCRYDTYVAYAFRKALNLPTSGSAAAKRKRKPKRDRMATRELMANKWGAAERHGKEA